MHTTLARPCHMTTVLMLACINADRQYRHRWKAYRDGVFEEGGAVGGQEGGTPQLPPWVIYVCILIGLPQDSICSPNLVFCQIQSRTKSSFTASDPY